MEKHESEIVCEMILNDLKYISVRSLYLDWFFPTAAETATQLLNNSVKIYLKTIGRNDIIKHILSWRGNETHNSLRMIVYLENELSLGLDLSVDEKQVLDNLYKLYKARYIESMDQSGAGTIMKDIHVIDKVYAFFRERSKAKLSETARKELFIEKALSHGKDMLWGTNNKSLAELLYLENDSFKA